jgi:hypothetical protein
MLSIFNSPPERVTYLRQTLGVVTNLFRIFQAARYEPVEQSFAVTFMCNSLHSMTGKSGHVWIIPILERANSQQLKQNGFDRSTQPILNSPCGRIV